MAHQVSPTTAQRVIRILEMHDGNASAAAHDVSVSLQAIEPYTDDATERVYTVLRKLSRWDGEKLDRNLRILKDLASKAEHTKAA